MYSPTSPWYHTSITNNYLDLLNIRSVSKQSDDPLFELPTVYTYRPDLLSYDLYGTPKLWWVFMQRNMDVIRDPIYDFVPGIKIYLPQKEGLFKVLGL